MYLTFQDDWVAFKLLDLMNTDRVMWANDHPHSDATWPWSQEMLTEQTTHMTEHPERPGAAGQLRRALRAHRLIHSPLPSGGPGGVNRPVWPTARSGETTLAP